MSTTDVSSGGHQQMLRACVAVPEVLALLNFANTLLELQPLRGSND